MIPGLDEDLTQSRTVIPDSDAVALSQLLLSSCVTDCSSSIDRLLSREWMGDRMSLC